ncbi:unnamed protein product [Mycena citricolor]|uniref:Zn(2)-C6 fungal-type domain-containing protein n=1 Tax=Mycena citricolor TaxID=2018698 RepID=A0AAD2HKR9_9AGAR|nr:unnamed protein product [Mycena citricolor]
MPPDTTPDSAALLKERRFKLSRACDRCRRRRIKCDEGHPCQACLAANSACTFEEQGKRTHPHKSKRTATLEDRMHQLETLVQAIPPAVFAATIGGAAPGGSGMGMGAPASPVAPYTAFTLPLGVPPPSLHNYPLTNPSTHFMPRESKQEERAGSCSSEMGDQLAEDTSRLTLSASYLYFDDEGFTRWQGEASGLPLLDLLVERHVPSTADTPPSVPAEQDWFPNRTARRMDVNPETTWRLITSYIPPELMDNLVQCFLSTSSYILPFLHVPTFLGDYSNPQKWGEPGFPMFIVAICCLASRHMDDPRVRSSPKDGVSAGTQWFELFERLRMMPIADRPTLYTIQANLIAAVYAVGLGKLTKAAALLSEAITMSIDAGLHRSADTYDLFDAIEEEVRKRTFWCVYIWDKQLSAHFGRPPMLRLRDCDVGEPAPVDDEYITPEGVGAPAGLPPGAHCRMAAFVVALRILVVLESVLDIPPARDTAGGSFLLRAASVLSNPRPRRELRDEETLLDEIHHSIPPHFAHSTETLASEDTIRVTQAVRLHCAEQFVRLLIYRHRFSELVAERTAPMDPIARPPQSQAEQDAMVKAHYAALQIVTSHVLIAKRGLMTYYGVHVIHQLTQAGRTLVAILLNCQTEPLQPLIQPGLDGVRSCVLLLRRFSGRYVCGQRSGDLMEEFCRLTQIPLGEPPETNGNPNARPPWVRPVRKKSVAMNAITSRSSEGSSPDADRVSVQAFDAEYVSSLSVDPLALSVDTDPRMLADVLAMFTDSSPTDGSQMFPADEFDGAFGAAGFKMGLTSP